MKIGKLIIKSGYRKVLLGLAVAGALLFASCQSPFSPPAQGPQENESGYGTVRVLFGDEEARTLFPDLPITNGVIVNNNVIKALEFDFIDVVTGGSKLTKIVVPGDTTWNGKFNVPEGDYTIEVRGYNVYTAGTALAVGAWVVYGEAPVSVVDGLEVAVKIGLVPVENTTKIGTFIIKVKYTATDSSGTVGTPGYDPGDGDGIANVTLEKIGESGSREVVWSYVQSLTSGTSYDSSLASGTGSGFGAASNGTGPLTKLDAGGDYLFTFRLNTSLGKYYGYTEAVHITNGLPTTFDRTGSDPNSVTRAITRIDLATMDADEAKALLARDIASWNGAANLISSVATTVVEDVDTSTDGEITVSYIWYKFADPANPANAFLTNLQGGWALVTGTDTWAVDGANLKSIVLKNSSVGITAFTVNLQPVTKFKVVYDASVTDKTGRTVTIGDKVFTDKGATDLIKINAGVAANAKVDIVINTAAITINGTEAVGDAQGKYTLSIPAATDSIKLESREYAVIVYKTATEQVSDAFADLKSHLLDKSWIDVPDALAFKGDDDSVWYKHDESGTNLESKYKTEIYYVASRNTSTSTPKEFRISLPQAESRWKMYDGNWTVGTQNRVQTKKVYFDPYGGKKQFYVYTVTLAPVAEYTVTFRKGPNNDDLPATGGIKVTNIALVPSTTAASPADVNIGFAQSVYKFIGGIDTATTIGGSVDVAKKVTITDQGGSAGDKLIITIGRTLANDGLSVSAAGDPDDIKVLTLATPEAQTASYLTTMEIALTSTEYKIDVFPTIKNQKEQYLKRFYDVTQADLVGTKGNSGWSGTAGFIKYTPDKLEEDWGEFTKPTVNSGVPAPATGESAPASSILYRGASVVTGGQIPPNSAYVPGVSGSSPVPAYNFLKGPDFAHYAAVPAATVDNSTDAANVEATALGITKYGFRWRPIGAKIPLVSSAPTPTPYPTVPTAGTEDYQDYVIKLISYARYNVVFRNGPYNREIAATDGIKITNILPGTKVKTTDITVNKGDASKTFIGGTYALSFTASMTDKLGIQDKGSAAAKSMLIVALFDGSTVLTPNDYKEAITNVASVASQEYTIYVYPTINEQAKQIKQKLAAMTLGDITGGGVTENNWFTGGPAASDYVKITNPTIGTDGVPAALSTEVWYVGSPPTAVQPKPSATFLPDGYTLVPVPSATPAPDLGTHVRGVTNAALKWTPLGGEVGSADNNSDRKDSVFYTFKLVAVAQYNVQYMKGPAGVEADGGILIATFRPGTDGDDDGGTAGVNKVSLNTATQSDKLLYGASGTGVTAALTVSNNNVISQNSATASTFVVSDGTNQDISLADNASSKKYSIKVYPPVVTQISEARKKMSTQDPISWIRATDTSAEFKLGKVIDVTGVAGTAAGNSTVYYHGSAPTFALPTAFGATGYNSVDTYWSIAANGTDIQLTPVLNTLTAQTVWTFNKTPVDRYHVVYSNGATGTVEVTPNSDNVKFVFASRGSTTGLQKLTFNSTTADASGVDGPAYASRIASSGTVVTVDAPYNYALQVRDANGLVVELTGGTGVFTGRKTLVIPTGTAAGGDPYRIWLIRMPD